MNTRISKSNPRGFALIATISVMVLLVMMALAMLSLSTIELRSARLDDAQSEARANARLGLMLALGQLQKSLGPDARATANSSMLDTDPATSDIDGITHSHWLGVYPTINPSNPDDGLLSPKALRDWSLQNMEWLVSSSDGAANPTGNLTENAVTLGQFINDATVTIPEGDGIDGIDPTTLSRARAGLVELDSNPGRYAWWVTDESMKARIDTRASTDGSDVLDGVAIDATAQGQSNYEVIQSTDFSSLLPSYLDTPDQLGKLITPHELQLLGQSSSNSSWKDWSRLNLDKFTPFARSLPVDVANGRLKKDLTAYFKGTYTGLDGEPMIDSRFSIAAERIPTFDLVKQWANLVDDPKTEQPVTVPDFSTSDPQHGLYPIVTQGAVALQHSYQITSPTTLKPVMMLMPQFQIWNPHNVPIKAQDYIIQVGYQFTWWMQASGTRNTDVINWGGPQPQWRSWVQFDSQAPLPIHKPTDNEVIDYQSNKRFFTFVIKNQSFKPGESLVFHAKPPASGPISGVPYNMNANADTDILNSYSNDAELNLLVNEGNLDEFFYIISPVIGTPSASALPDMNNKFDTESNFRSNETGTGLTNREDLDVHLNLYVYQDDKPALIHAMKKPQQNERFGNWRRNTYPLNRYQDGELFASETYDGKSPLINLGSSMLVSNFDIFQGGSNMNLPPKAGQPHSMLGYWNIRNQESFSSSTDWESSSLEALSWLNTFSFRSVGTFKSTWEGTDSLYGNLSMDRLGGWHLSQVQGMAYPFFDYPSGDYGPMSMGSFQHANLSPYGWQPTYAFGNSQAPPRFDRSTYKSSDHDDLYDISYLLNASTWDSHYLSTIPQSGVTLKKGMRLPNSRINIAENPGTLPFDAANLNNARGYNLSAAHVLIHGGFNVNSTSFAAWKAFLTGALGESVQTLQNAADSNSATAAAMGRFLNPLLGEPESVTNDRSTTEFDKPRGWATTRTLNKGEIDALVNRVIEEVKRRGPFLSLADFINRRLQPDADVTGDELVYQQVLGTLQAAINKATLEDQKINHHYYATGGNPLMTIKPATDWNSLGFNVSTDAQEAMFGYPVSKINSDGGLIHNFAPNFLSQADVLTKAGPSITVRGDTFTVRAYGDALDSNGKILARAWCEAVVQRVAEPISWDGSDARLIQPQQPNESGFGRRFRIISFRWLNAKDVQPYSDDDAITS